MIRAKANLTVRGVATQRTGTTNGRAWAFLTVPVLDDDYNKVDVTLGDEVDPSIFGAGVTVSATCDVNAVAGRLRVTVLSAEPVKRAS